LAQASLCHDASSADTARRVRGHSRCSRTAAKRSGHPAAERDDLKETIMLYYAALFFVIALVAALFGFGGIAAGAAEIAKVLFFIFLVLFVVSLIAGTLRRGP
jgi:uncharacterized membrane protein YtjA (UPF0391 family)